MSNRAKLFAALVMLFFVLDFLSYKRYGVSVIFGKVLTVNASSSISFGRPNATDEPSREDDR